MDTALHSKLEDHLPFHLADIPQLLQAVRYMRYLFCITHIPMLTAYELCICLPAEALSTMYRTCMTDYTVVSRVV